MVLFRGAGSELYRGMGSVVLGGLLVSTIFTLVLVPTVFILLMDAKGFLVQWLGRLPDADFEMEAIPEEQMKALPKAEETIVESISPIELAGEPNRTNVSQQQPFELDR